MGIPVVGDCGFNRVLKSVQWSFFFDTAMGETYFKLEFHAKSGRFSQYMRGDDGWTDISKEVFIRKLKCWLDDCDDNFTVCRPKRKAGAI